MTPDEHKTFLQCNGLYIAYAVMAAVSLILAAFFSAWIGLPLFGLFAALALAAYREDRRDAVDED